MALDAAGAAGAVAGAALAATASASIRRRAARAGRPRLCQREHRCHRGTAASRRALAGPARVVAAGCCER